MKGIDYSYRSSAELQLTTLTEEAKRERYYDELKPQIDQIKNKLSESKKNDLISFKDQIKSMLEEEIAARYYLEKGAVETAFKHDKEVLRAIEVLHQPAQYNKILNVNP